MANLLKGVRPAYLVLGAGVGAYVAYSNSKTPAEAVSKLHKYPQKENEAASNNPYLLAASKANCLVLREWKDIKTCQEYKNFLLQSVVNDITRKAQDAAAAPTTLERLVVLRNIEKEAREARVIALENASDLKKAQFDLKQLEGVFQESDEVYLNSNGLRDEILENVGKQTVRFLNQEGGSFEKMADAFGLEGKDKEALIANLTATFAKLDTKGF